MSYHREVRGGKQFDALAKYIEEELKIHNAAIATFKKWQSIESDYSKSLQKLFQSVKIPERVGAPSVNTITSELDQYGTYALIRKANASISERAFQHENLASCIGTIADSLRGVHWETDNKRKKIVADYQYEFKNMQDAHTQLKKMHQQVENLRKGHIDAKKKARSSVRVVVGSKAVSQSRENNMTKLLMKEQASEVKMEESMVALQQFERNCQGIRNEHYHKTLPRSLKLLEDAEHERCSQLHMFVTIWGKEVAAADATASERASLFVNVMESCDSSQDLVRFCEQNSCVDTELPATALVDCTIRDRLESCTYYDDSKGMRESVFLFVAEKRQLYQYDEDDSTSPRAIHTIMKSPEAIQGVDKSLFSCSDVYLLRTTAGTLYLDLSRTNLQSKWLSELYESTGNSSALVAKYESRRQLRRIEIGVLEGKDLPRSGDYYCVVLIEGNAYARTNTQHATDKPFWGQHFELDNAPVSYRSVSVQLNRVATSILRKAPASSSEPVGQIKMRLNASNSDLARGSWLSLYGSEYDASLRLSVRYTHEDVLPLAEYDRLGAALVFDDTAMTGTSLLKWLNAVVAPASRAAFATTLLRCTSSLKYLCTLIRVEVEQTPDASVLFRGNSLTTCTLDVFLKILTMEQSDYLKSTLGQLVRSICDGKISCEVDPTRIPGGDPKEVASGLEKLTTLAQAFWDAICASCDRLPHHVKYIFDFLQRAVFEKFQSPAARQSAVASFLFLRLLCPAILGPHLFNLQSRYPTGAVLRTLTLVSKCIQNLANGVAFGAKEPYLHSMNAFLDANKASVTTCLDAAVRCPRAAPPDTLDLGAIDKARAYAALIAAVEAARATQQQRLAGGDASDVDEQDPAVARFLDAIHALRTAFPPVQDRPTKPQKPRRGHPGDVHSSKSMPASPVASRVSSSSSSVHGTVQPGDSPSAAGAPPTGNRHATSTATRLFPQAHAAPVLVRPSALSGAPAGPVSRQTSAPPPSTSSDDIDGMVPLGI
eukprot:m.661249 g.661249  ORF g.661249 m.661249 type:complete len:998 (-) comp22736_c0_seq1:429-3422(-)